MDGMCFMKCIFRISNVPSAYLFVFSNKSYSIVVFGYTSRLHDIFYMHVCIYIYIICFCTTQIINCSRSLVMNPVTFFSCLCDTQYLDISLWIVSHSYASLHGKTIIILEYNHQNLISGIRLDAAKNMFWSSPWFVRIGREAIYLYIYIYIYIYIYNSTLPSLSIYICDNIAKKPTQHESLA